MTHDRASVPLAPEEKPPIARDPGGLDASDPSPSVDLDPLAALIRDAQAAAGALSDVFHTQLDLARITVRDALLRLLLAAALSAALAVTVVIGLIMLFVGVAGAVSVGFAVPLWIGHLAAGAIAITLPLAILIARSAARRAGRLERTRKRYESRRIR